MEVAYSVFVLKYHSVFFVRSRWGFVLLPLFSMWVMLMVLRWFHNFPLFYKRVGVAYCLKHYFGRSEYFNRRVK